MSDKEIEMQDKIDKLKAMNDEMYQHIVMLQEHKAFADNTIEQYATKCKRYEEHIAELEKALEMACVQLDEARDMLFECNKPEWARMLDTSADYFKARAKREQDKSKKVAKQTLNATKMEI